MQTVIDLLNYCCVRYLQVAQCWIVEWVADRWRWRAVRVKQCSDGSSSWKSCFSYDAWVGLHCLSPLVVTFWYWKCCRKLKWGRSSEFFDEKKNLFCVKGSYSYVRVGKWALNQVCDAVLVHLTSSLWSRGGFTGHCFDVRAAVMMILINQSVSQQLSWYLINEGRL